MDKVILGGVIGLVIGFAVSQFMVSPDEHKKVSSHSHMSEQADHHHTDTHAHSHGIAVVADSVPVPTVSIEAIKDTKDGYNIRIDAEHFTFNPEAVNEDVVQNEGHAHLYVNGKKIARLYGQWFHLSDDLLEEGENNVEVTLNANDHSEWVSGEETVSDAVTVTK